MTVLLTERLADRHIPYEQRKDRPLWSDVFRVDIPPAAVGDLQIERFTVDSRSLTNFRYAMDGRGCRDGTYTRLIHNGTLWMSDTDAEVRDHFEPYRRAKLLDGRGRVLINGLGLGVLLHAILPLGSVREIDVVELNPDIVTLVGPWYIARAAEHGVDLRIHLDDAFTIKWPRHTRWDVVWHDIWPTICEDDLDEHSRLQRRYGSRADWQGCWVHDRLLYERRSGRRRSGWW